MTKPFPLYTQLDAMDCGPSSLRMIAKHYGRTYTLQTLREKSFITREGVSMPGISDTAESIGIHTQGVRINSEQLVNDALLPCMLHRNQNHFGVRMEFSNERYVIKHVILFGCYVFFAKFVQNSNIRINN